MRRIFKLCHLRMKKFKMNAISLANDLPLDIAGFGASFVRFDFGQCSGKVLPCRRSKIVCDFLQIRFCFVTKLKANTNCIPTIKILRL